MAIVQSLWIGNKLSIMENLCIHSFLKNGYEYHLYTYNFVENVPNGTIIKDANEVLNSSEIYSYANSSFSAISNRFRFELLYKKGGMWVDTDVVCIKKYDIDEAKDKYIIFSESNKKYNEQKIGACVLKFPKEDPILLEAIQICKDKKQDIINGTLVWGLGPSTVKHLVEKYKLEEYVKNWKFANSCSCHHVMTIINPNFKTGDPKGYASNINELSPDTYFIHLWHEFWRRNNIDKDSKYQDDSLFEQLKAKYLC
jgi:mannosyltransferase OCH1-like enzyme